MNELSDNKTDQEIINLLDRVCKHASFGQELCEEYIQEQINEIVQAIKNGSDPQQWCSTLRLCPPSPAVPAVSPEVVITEIEREEQAVPEQENELEIFPSCRVCEVIVDWIGNQISENRTAAAIESALDRICPVFYASRLSQCERSVAKWSARVVVAMELATSSKIACELLSMCATANELERNEGEVPAALPTVPDANEIPEVASGNQPRPPHSDQACFECQSIAHFIQTELYDYNKEQAIEQWTIKNTCDRALNVSCTQLATSLIDADQECNYVCFVTVCLRRTLSGRRASRSSRSMARAFCSLLQ